MGYINKKNKVGSVSETAAPFLLECELGIDLNPSDGDMGRVYVGDGTNNVALAKKAEIVALDAKIDAITTSNAVAMAIVFGG